MDNKERLARMLYHAYGALCYDNSQTFTKEEAAQLRSLRELLHSNYLEYSPNADYDMGDLERTKMAYQARPYNPEPPKPTLKIVK